MFPIQKATQNRMNHEYCSICNIKICLLSLTHWGRVTYICVNKLTIIGSDNGLSPGRRQAIIWTNAGILFIGPLGTNFSEILIQTFSFKKMYLKMSSGKWRPSCLSLNVLIQGTLIRTSSISVYSFWCTNYFNTHSLSVESPSGGDIFCL